MMRGICIIGLVTAGCAKGPAPTGDVLDAAGGSSQTSDGKLWNKVWYSGETVTLAMGTAWGDPMPDPTKGSSMISESTVEPHSGAKSLEADLNWIAGYYGAAFGFNFAQYSAAR